MNNERTPVVGTSIYDVFKTDEALENEGRWFNYGPGPNGKEQRFLLGRMSRSNKRYSAAFKKFYDEYGQQMEAKTLADEVGFEALLEIFCATVLRDWENIPGCDGEIIPFSVENAKNYLRELKDLYAELTARAQSREHYAEARKVVDAKNL